MDNDQRKKLVNDVKSLQRLVRTLERSLNRIGKTNDTTSWRSTLNSDLLNGTNLKQTLQQTTNRLRAQSIDPQSDKLLTQADPIVQKYNDIANKINEKLQQHDPINDNYNNNNNNAYGDDDNAYGNYVPPPNQPQQNQQQSLEKVGFVAIGADLDHLEEQNKAVNKIADDVQELNEAFTDLNTLVNDQGDQIVEMQENVSAAKENVESATIHLQKAEKYQKKARKKACYVLICLIVIVGIIFALLGGFGVF